MRKSSYQSHFYSEMTGYFPENGERVQVYVGKPNGPEICPSMFPNGIKVVRLRILRL